MFKFIICTLCLLMPLSTQAKLYKIIKPDGTTKYTDIPPSMDAKEYKLKGINAITNPRYNMQKLSMVIPYTDNNGSMIVQGLVNGVPIRFVVDTGATLLAIPPTIAKKAGLYDVQSKQVTAQTANGAIQVQKVSIKSVNVAKINQSDVDATIQSVSSTEDNLGLLGMSFFNRYKMTIDQSKKEIQLEPK